MDSVRIILIYTDHTSSTRGSQMAAISIAKTTTSTNMMAAPYRKQANQKGSPMGHAFCQYIGNKPASQAKGNSLHTPKSAKQ